MDIRRIRTRVFVSLLALSITATVWLALFMEIHSPLAADTVVIRAIAAWPVSCDCDTMYMKYFQEINKRGKGRLQIRFLGGPDVTPAFEQF